MVFQRFLKYWRRFLPQPKENRHKGTFKNRFEKGKWVECTECEKSLLVRLYALRGGLTKQTVCIHIFTQTRFLEVTIIERVVFMKITAVIMAGGKGERFWPKSRNSRPKQFLSLSSDGETMIQKTVKRLLPLVAAEDIFIVTNSKYAELVKQQLPDINSENVIFEPIARNTAPCIALAAGIIRKKYGEDSVMLVLPSDHFIKFDSLFINTLKLAVHKAEQGDNLVTIGITPTYPETGYGYINFSAEYNTDGIYEVVRFVEKPGMELAREYVNSGEYLWNSGMFVWKTSVILKKLQELLPEIYEKSEQISSAYATDEFEEKLNGVFPQMPAESIDFGVMEHADNIYTIPGSFGWDDVGSWLVLGRLNPANEFGNVVMGDAITINTRNTIISGDKKLIATVGVEDLVVVDTPDALLICSKSSTQDVKKVTETLKICNRSELI